MGITIKSQSDVVARSAVCYEGEPSIDDEHKPHGPHRNASGSNRNDISGRSYR
jgi:hypothetical protein